MHHKRWIDRQKEKRGENIQIPSIHTAGAASGKTDEIAATVLTLCGFKIPYPTCCLNESSIRTIPVLLMRCVYMCKYFVFSVCFGQ